MKMNSRVAERQEVHTSDYQLISSSKEKMNANERGTFFTLLLSSPVDHKPLKVEKRS